MELIFSKNFKKQAQKLVENKKNLKPKIKACLQDFQKEGRKSNFYRKKLKGKWFPREELEIGGDIRLIVRVNDQDNQAVFEAIGTHSQLGL